MHAKEVEWGDDLGDDADEDLELHRPELAQIGVCEHIRQLQHGQDDLDNISCDLDEHPIAQFSALVAQHVVGKLVELGDLTLQEEEHCDERADRHRQLRQVEPVVVVLVDHAEHWER